MRRKIVTEMTFYDQENQSFRKKTPRLIGFNEVIALYEMVECEKGATASEENDGAAGAITTVEYLNKLLGVRTAWEWWQFLKLPMTGSFAVNPDNGWDVLDMLVDGARGDGRRIDSLLYASVPEGYDVLQMQKLFEAKDSDGRPFRKTHLYRALLGMNNAGLSVNNEGPLLDRLMIEELESGRDAKLDGSSFPYYILDLSKIHLLRFNLFMLFTLAGTALSVGRPLPIFKTSRGRIEFDSTGEKMTTVSFTVPYYANPAERGPLALVLPDITDSYPISGREYRNFSLATVSHGSLDRGEECLFEYTTFDDVPCACLEQALASDIVTKTLRKYRQSLSVSERFVVDQEKQCFSLEKKDAPSGRYRSLMEACIQVLETPKGFTFCENCGTPILLARSNKRFCGDACRKAYSRKKKGSEEDVA